MDLNNISLKVRSFEDVITLLSAFIKQQFKFISSLFFINLTHHLNFVQYGWTIYFEIVRVW